MARLTQQELGDAIFVALVAQAPVQSLVELDGFAVRAHRIAGAYFRNGGPRPGDPLPAALVDLESAPADESAPAEPESTADDSPPVNDESSDSP